MKTKLGRLAGSTALAKPGSDTAASRLKISREKRIRTVKAKRLANDNAKTQVLGCHLLFFPLAIPPRQAAQI